MKRISIPWKAWHGDDACALFFPEAWDVQLCTMADAPALSELEIRKAMSQPIGKPGLGAVASAARTVAIAVDDITRPTPTSKLLPIVLEQLGEAGIEKENIKIIIASGAHQSASRNDLVRKLGENVAREYRIVRHDPNQNLAEVGTNLDKTPVRINKEFLESDLKLSMGCITPHPFAGFSGGGKLVIPGLASMEIIERTHRYVMMGLRGGMGVVEGNQFREEVEEVCRRWSSYLILDVVINRAREIAGLFVGDLKSAFQKGVEFARKVYRTPLPANTDIAVLNAYPKDIDLIQSENAFNVLRSTAQPFVRDGGKIVLVTASSDGRGVHGLFQPGGRLYRKPIRKRWLGNRDLIVFSPGISKDEFQSLFWEGYSFGRTWNEVLRILGDDQPNYPKVAVFPCASVQLGVTQ